MDKYEFNIKVEQIKKLVNRGDYETAMKIADTIDWRRVRNASLLSMIAQIYEKNEEYQEAKDILLLAFERAPVGKRLLFKLTDLALKEGSVQEAEAYYREFCDLAGDDPRQYLLRYLILKTKKAPIDQLIRALEAYTAVEVDEKWLYELAELYAQAGMESECVAACDKIMLLFGLGKYVDKAMDLKLNYAPLNKYQMDLVENRDKYEAKLRAVEEEYSGGGTYQEEYEEPKTPEEPEVSEEPEIPERNVDDDVVIRLHEDAQAQKLALEMSRMADEMQTSEVEVEEDMEPTKTLDDLHTIKDIKPTQRVLVAAAEREKTEAEIENEREIERQRAAIRAAKAREEMEEEALRRAEEERESARREEEERHARKQAEIDRERALSGQVRTVAAEPEDDDLQMESLDEVLDTYNLMIEAYNAEDGLAVAIDALREIHKALGYKNPVAKISSEKLNKRGISAVAPKLVGKDLVIESAAGLTSALQNELDELMEKDKSGMIVVLIDTPERLEELHARNTTLSSKFLYIGADASAAEKQETERTVEEALKKETLVQEQIAQDVVRSVEKGPEASAEPSAEETMRAAAAAPQEHAAEAPARSRTQRQPEKTGRADVPEQRTEASAWELDEHSRTQEAKDSEISASLEDFDDVEEMDIEEFAQFACRYASEIDCSIAGKSKLALYERIEMMEEDGVPLTKRNAAKLIEEAADKAEKPSLGKKITGLFSSKYDKDGNLILHEDNFFD